MSEQRSGARPPAAESNPPPPIRALVVDDDPVFIAVLTRFLSQRGYAVEHSLDGESALARIRAGGFNLVVTDRNMPGMDGVELARAIRSLSSSSYVYSIMLTASRDEASLVAAMEAGVDDFVAKPLSLAELGARLQAAERVLTLEAGLARRNEQLARAYGQLRSDLELARTLQVGHLPAPGAFGRVRFDWRFEASGYVGGDTFDYFRLGERHLCFYLADVSGHGVAAAMMAFHAQHQLRASSEQITEVLARRGTRLGATVAAVATEYNLRFLRMQNENLYLTMLFGLVDLDSGRAALVQAGHPPPFFAAAGEEEFRPLGGGGVPIGIVEQPDYEPIELQLSTGARLVLYSDGVTDCRDAGDAAFGEQRLRDVLLAQRHAPLGEMGEQVHQALRAWRPGATFEDDVTLLALEAH
ncbi:MAG TPA: SpoIIE family protein phosphatase [Ramlibacter sp.]|jgi:sigma-B regulation protein RsbU (phosphoserine phosphatase)|nr:SpoIIE family protein phosphatase [Ramlibacter sp.]